MKKKVLISSGAIILLIVIIFHNSIGYGFNQAKGQLSIIWNVQSVEEVVQNPNYPDSLKRKINLINKVREYSFDSIGLLYSENYTSFYDQKGEVLLWNLSASHPFKLEPKTWSFPFLGSFPYKGYFDLEKAKEEYNELKENGYDARIRAVGGWSTLGWFKDPILSNMLERSEGNLTELIIHELTHSTLFVKDNIEFNENLASFIGEQGALLFLRDRFGVDSKELTEYQQSEEDAEIFVNHMLLVTKKLDSLYQSFPSELPDSLKLNAKHLLIDQITSSLDTITFNNKKYNNIFSKSRPNNAYFLSFLRYHSSEDSLDYLLKSRYKNNLPLFIEEMKNYHK
ncbi:MAG: aminopeptidase [Ekhidna sp.]